MVSNAWRAPLTVLAITAAFTASATAAQAAIRAPGTVANPTQTATAGTPCTAGGIHCYTPQQVRDAYGVSALPNKGDGQTIVLVDSYGTPTGAQDLQTFHDTFFVNEPNPKFDQVYPNGKPNYTSCKG